jgi:hypothetical protein
MEVGYKQTNNQTNKRSEKKRKKDRSTSLLVKARTPMAHETSTVMSQDMQNMQCLAASMSTLECPGRPPERQRIISRV